MPRRALPALFFLSALIFGTCRCSSASRSRPAAALQLQVSARTLEVREFASAWIAHSQPLAGAVHFVLKNAAGKIVWQSTAAAAAPQAVFALPHPGVFRLEAQTGSQRFHAALEALAPPPPWYGGVLPLQTRGLPGSVSDYLRAHGFEVATGLSGAPPRLIVLARTDLSWQRYLRLWQEVAQGSNLLLLHPPAPAAAPAWPLRAQLVAWNPARCDAGFFSIPTLDHALDARARAALQRRLRPRQAYDLRRQPEILPLSLSGRMLAIGRYHAPRLGCRPLFAFRFGRGLVVVSSLPVLSRFANAWDRLYLMNLLKTAARKLPGPAAPGLAYVQRARLRKLVR